MQWYVYALIAAMLLGLTNIFRKKILFREPSREYAVVFITLTALCSAAFLPWVTFALPLQIYGLILVIAFLAFTGHVYFFKAIKHFDLSTVLPLTMVQPIIILMLSIVFLNEHISLVQLIGIALILVGGYALELNSHVDVFHPIKLLRKSKYQRYIFAAIMLISLVIFFDKMAINLMKQADLANPAYTLTFMVWTSMAVMSLIWYLPKHSFTRALHRAFRKEGILLILPSFTMAVYLLFYYQAASLQFISLVLPIIKLSALFAVILGGRIFHEKNLLFKSGACVVMILGTFFILQ